MTATMIEARATRTTSNALTMTFLDSGIGEPMAVAVQGGADGKGAKVATLFGFKNGGAGTHLVTYQDGSALSVKSVSAAPTEITRADGVTIATIERGDEESVARAAGGTTILRFTAHPDGAKTPDVYRLVHAADGSEAHWVSRDRTDAERDVLVAVSIDIAIGLRPYVKEMKSRR